MNIQTKKALGQYKKLNAETNVAFASPHKLIQMLFDGALEKIAVAKGALSRGDTAIKGKSIGWAISIIDGLKISLDKDSGGEIAENLESLYLYMMDTLLHANLENDEKKLDEVSNLLKTIKSAWDEIGKDNSVSTSASSSEQQILDATVR